MSNDRQLNYVNKLQNRDQRLYYVDDASELNSINLEENDKIYAINDNKLFQMEIVDQEEELNGSIVSFNGRNNTKIKSLVMNIEPVQDLHGYDNPWLAGGGANQWDEQWELGQFNNTTGEPIANNECIRTKNFISVLPETSYYTTYANGNFQVFFYKADETYISQTWIGSNGLINTPAECAKMKFRLATAYGTTYKNDIAINYPSTVTTYSPYKNICPISGWIGAEIQQTGINIWNEEWELGQFNNATGEPIAANDCIRTKNFIDVKPQKTYRTTYGDAKMQVFFYEENGTYISQIWIASYTIITPTNCYKMKFRLAPVYGTIYNHDVSINYPSTDITYHSYTGNQIFVNWEDAVGTIYGGNHEVVSGKLKSTMGIFKFENYSGNISSDAANANGIIRFVATIINKKQGTANLISNLMPTSSEFVPSDTDKEMLSGFPSSSGLYISIKASRLSGDLTTGAGRATAFRTWCTENGFEICYELAEPIEYTLTPQEITTLYGTNNIWSNIGDITVKIAEKGITAFELEPHI